MTTGGARFGLTRGGCEGRVRCFMRVLLTGAAGFIGSHTAEALLARGDGVVGLDNFNDFYDPAIKRRNAAAVAARGGAAFELAEGDITDEGFLDAVFAAERF